MHARALFIGAVLLSVVPLTSAQNAPPPGGDYVTREEYDKLKAQLDAVQKDMATMRQQQQQAQQQQQQLQQQVQQQKPTSQADIDETLDEIEKNAHRQDSLIEGLRLGDSKLLITGYGFAGYNDRHGEHSSFDAGFNPIFVWKLNDRLLFEGELEFGFEGEDTTTSLEYADLSYIVNDYLTVGAGKFLLPFGIFNQRLHPAWINKLPDRPLPFADGGIAPEFDIGAFARGGAPLGSTMINYQAYVVNGPTLNTDDPDVAGQLGFENNSDVNDNKAVGGRIGWLPIPEVELGYSFQYGEVSPSGFDNTSALLQAVDASYVQEIDPILGRLDLRAEWVWSNVDDATYDPTGSLGFGPTRFSNNRNGGYLQAAYRPTKVMNHFIQNTEFIVRYDMLNVPDEAPGSFDEQRLTFGLDYWLTPSVVLKAAYEVDNRKHEDDQNAFLLQLGFGF